MAFSKAWFIAPFFRYGLIHTNASLTLDKSIAGCLFFVALYSLDITGKSGAKTDQNLLVAQVPYLLLKEAAQWSTGANSEENAGAAFFFV